MGFPQAQGLDERVVQMKQQAKRTHVFLIMKNER